MNNVYEAGRYGILPVKAPLATPLVPYQMDNPPKYEIRQGLIKGTLFPGLDLPYRNMINTKEKPVTPLTELQAMAFAIQELALYLDTHREDLEALELYQTYQQLYHDAAKNYSKQETPLNHNIPSSGKYNWLDGPWPWEYSENQEE